jgi:hypothetical protein
MADPLDYTLTKHAIERLCERSENFARIIADVSVPSLKIKATYDFMRAASEEKSFQNNTRFMTMLGEKYGFENCYTMFVRENSVFVGVSNSRGKYIVTVLKRDDHYLPHIRNKVQKFEKKQSAKLGVYFPPGARR